MTKLLHLPTGIEFTDYEYTIDVFDVQSPSSCMSRDDYYYIQNMGNRIAKCLVACNMDNLRELYNVGFSSTIPGNTQVVNFILTVSSLEDQFEFIYD